MIELAGIVEGPVAVMGLGLSGLATARALIDAGVDTRAWDDGAERRAAAAAAGVPIMPLPERLVGARSLVLSPGIPLTHPAPHPVAAAARAAGIEIIGDIELLARADRSAAFIGITGTNGKSTTTALLGHVLAACGRRVAVGGNLGVPVLSLPKMGPGGTYVLELSSYQLDLTVSTTFDIAVLLNVTPDHLDRHGGMDGYVAAKTRVFARQRPGTAAIVGIDDDPCRAVASRLAASGHGVVPVSVLAPAAGGVDAIDGRLVDRTGPQPVAVADLTRIATLPGAHNWQNAAAAYAAARAAGVPAERIADALAGFAGLAHRQQLVATIRGVRYVNDSKATNADAAAKALVCYRPIYWIAGGRPKAGGLDGLETLLGGVRHAFLIGEAEADFASWLEGRAPATRCGTLDRALEAAALMAEDEGLADATVLLSPACASFDQFASFEARGEAFMRLVRARAARMEAAR